MVSTGSTTGDGPTTGEVELPAEEYVGSAVVSTGSTPGDGDGSTTGTEVQVNLRGRFEPLDGRFHWYGRIAADPLAELRAGMTVTLTTSRGSAEGRLSDIDPWGRFRISGTGRPPF
jgi:hypothetical protein